MTYDVSATREIASPTAKIWGMVTDLPRMGEWSPENRGGRWLNGASGAAPGAGFRGVNRRGFLRWSTRVTIDECIPDRVLEFSVLFGLSKVARWRYELEDTEGGCRVTESWVDLRSPIVRLAGEAMGSHGEAHTRETMAATLANLARVAEA
jgi:uncharacterized protein YndB with AHSA1/START domain